jgi:Uma2 family endonuclease
MSLRPSRLSFAEFLAYEATQEGKHEFVDGLVVDFVGGDLRHALIVTNVIAAIRPVLHPPAIVIGSDAVIPTERGARHADIVVTAFDAANPQPLVRAPSTLVEVISDLTAVIDMTEKVEEYTAIPHLREYVIVDSRKRWVQVVRRDAHEWRYAVPQISGSLVLQSLDLVLDFDTIYADAGITARGASA